MARVHDRSGRCTRCKPDDRRCRRRTSPTVPPQISDDGKTVTVKISRASSSARRSTARSRPRTSSTRSSAASTRTSPTATPAPTSARSRAPTKRQGRRQADLRHQTPDDTTIVFKLTKPTGAADRAGARRCRCRHRCRRSTRPKYDAKTPSTYGTAPGLHRPVHDQERRAGQAHRLQAGKSIDARPQPELGRRRRTTGRPTSTRSTSRTATTRHVGSRRRSSTARAWSAATSPAAGDAQAGRSRRKQGPAPSVPPRRQPLHRR